MVLLIFCRRQLYKQPRRICRFDNLKFKFFYDKSVYGNIKLLSYIPRESDLFTGKAFQPADVAPLLRGVNNDASGQIRLAPIYRVGHEYQGCSDNQ